MTIAGSIINVVLLVLKFAAGILGHSAAMIADAIHSLTDFATDVVVLVFVKLGNKPKDKEQLAQSVKQDDTSVVKMIQYKPNNLTYEVKSNKGGVIVFSEIYYPGWTAAIMFIIFEF